MNDYEKGIKGFKAFADKANQFIQEWGNVAIMVAQTFDESIQHSRRVNDARKELRNLRIKGLTLGLTYSEMMRELQLMKFLKLR